MSYSELGQYLFVSMNKKKTVGSVYYQKGRMRLVHIKGPKISMHTNTLYVLTGKQTSGDTYFNDNLRKLKKIGGINEIIDFLDSSNYNDYKILDCSSQLLLNSMNHADKMLHLVSVKNITEPVYYLLELHFDASKSPLYEARHPSRGGAVYVSIDQRASCYEDLYKVASNEKIKDVNNKNFCIYGIFNGFYDFKGGRPFNIHSPYEYIK